MCNCSKLGQKRPLKIIGKHSFRETLVNIYSENENVEPINPNITLKEETKHTNDFFKRGIQNVPYNAYLFNNFVQNKYKPYVYNRINKDTSLPCPICISKKSLCKSKHHKTSDVYLFKKNEKTYLGCFRAKRWNGDRYFLDLKTNKVEHVPKSENNNISPNIVSSMKKFKTAMYHEDAKQEIKDLLNQSVNFGKYNGKLVKDLFKDTSYVNYIVNHQTWKGEAQGHSVTLLLLPKYKKQNTR
jgi:hypothetical protein